MQASRGQTPDWKELRAAMNSVKPLQSTALCWHCDTEQLAFQTTDDLEDLTEILGQARAVEAIGFAVGMRRPGYNLYALGPDGIGKHTVVRRFLEETAAADPAPPDICYVSNFDEPRKPKVLSMPAGMVTAVALLAV